MFHILAGEKPVPELMRNFTCDRPLNCVAVRPSPLGPTAVARAVEPPRLTFQAAAEDAVAVGCQPLAGGGQDARDVALVGAGTDVDQPRGP